MSQLFNSYSSMIPCTADTRHDKITKMSPSNGFVPPSEPVFPISAKIVEKIPKVIKVIPKPTCTVILFPRNILAKMAIMTI